MGRAKKDTQPYVHLKKDPFTYLTRVVMMPLQKNLLDFCRGRTPRVTGVERGLAQIRKRLPVPMTFAVAFEEYVRQIYGDGWIKQFPASGDVWEPALTPPQIQEQEGHWWDWNSITSAIFNKFQLPERMFLADPPHDIPYLAEIVMRRVGEMIALPTDTKDATACIERGQSWMQRTVQEYTTWLLGMHNKDPHAVMHIVHRPESGRQYHMRRVGVTISFGITESAANRFLAGRISDKELTPDDLESSSNYLFTNAVFQSYDADDIPASTHAADQINALMLQSAYFTRYMKPLRPTVITFAGTPLFRERLLRHGFTYAGTCMPNSDIPIMVNRPDSLRLSYILLLFSLRAYRNANYLQWRCEIDDF